MSVDKIEPVEGADQNSDRRDSDAPRMHYEALVEVGAGPDGGFEAESLDLSLEGIRLRTAYVPEPGEVLIFRFDGFGGEIIAEGEVVWSKNEERGGEFGVRFRRLDKNGARLLEQMCQSDAPVQPTVELVDPKADAIGSRVRLHIQGLGSPMRARVRDTAKGEVLIGSNLEFLKVGRNVELENLEGEKDGDIRREAMIEHVGVNIDPETQIPQLVVALRFDGEVDAESMVLSVPPNAPLQLQQLEPAKAEAMDDEEEITPQPQVIDRELEGPVATTPSPMVGDVEDAAMHMSASDGAAIRTAQIAASIDDALHEEPATTVQVDEAPSMSERATGLVRQLGPTISSASSGAKGAIGSVLGAIRKRRDERQQEKELLQQPRRKTAPPPSGALRSDGRRLFREAQQAAQQEAGELPTIAASTGAGAGKMRVAAGAVVGLLAVVALYLGAQQLMTSSSVPDTATAAKAVSAEQANPSDAEAAKAGALPQGGAVATAKVPLFGATPMSTTEVVPVPPNLNADGTAAEPPPSSADDEESGDDGKDDAEQADAGDELDKRWGVGDVSDPTVLRLKMDGVLAGFRGKETATGFVLSVPNRKSISTARGMARRDRRIKEVNVVNYPDHAEIQLSFKGDRPAFAAHVAGKRVVIEIDGPRKKKRRKKKRKKSKKKKLSKKKRKATKLSKKKRAKKSKRRRKSKSKKRKKK